MRAHRRIFIALGVILLIFSFVFGCASTPSNVLVSGWYCAGGYQDVELPAGMDQSYARFDQKIRLTKYLDAGLAVIDNEKDEYVYYVFDPDPNVCPGLVALMWNKGEKTRYFSYAGIVPTEITKEEFNEIVGAYRPSIKERNT
jgi:hypothetical protein